MGNWQLEVAKMVIYMSFPVALFHYFNQPQYFEEWVVSLKRELYPPENEKAQEELRQALQKLREEQNLNKLKAYEKLEKN